MRYLILFLIVLGLAPVPALAQQQDAFDYWSYDRALIKRGVQAVLMCNGLFTSHRSLDLVLEQELAYLGTPPEPFTVVDSDRAVEVGLDDGIPTMRAAFREGIGCVILAPDQTLDDLSALPKFEKPSPPYDPGNTPWPMGDFVPREARDSSIDQQALTEASDWAFSRPQDRQRTLSLLIVHRGKIVHERYADGVDMHTRTRTWSTAKSIAVSLFGILVEQGRLTLDDPVDIDWLPELRAPESDPRRSITLRHLLNMSSGLEPVDNSGMEYATGSGLSYWAGTSSAVGARSRGLVREPGSYWDYENYDTLLGVLAMKKALGSDSSYSAFPRSALLDKLGMWNTLLSTDRFGDFILSSQVYTNARDLARFGLLYLNAGVWQDERLLSGDWIDFVRTPAPSTLERGRFYGGQWWLVPDDRFDVPPDAYATAGNRGQFVLVVPSHDLVVVRRGLDFGRQGFDRWDLLREVLKAFSESDD